METKKEIRDYIKAKKKKLSRDVILYNSNIITKKLIELSEYKDSDCIFIYVSFNEEVITNDIILDALCSGKRVAVPMIRNNHMDFYYIKSLKDLEPGFFGILEPKEMFLAKEKNPYIIMPGLAFDIIGHRIGYGKGYYDDYLKNHVQYERIALAYRFQVFDEIPYEEHDISINRIITEKEVITLKRK